MSWVALTGPQLDRLAARLGCKSTPGGLRGLIRTPPWYRQGALLRLRFATGVASFIAAGTGDIADRTLFMLDGSSGPVHDGNRAAGIAIRTAEEAADYLRFFCAAIEGEDGPFHIVGRLMPGWSVDSAKQSAIAPPSIAPADKPGLFTGTAHVAYDEMLFIAHFVIQADGMVEMTDDEPVGPLVPANRPLIDRQLQQERASRSGSAGPDGGRLQ